MLSAAVVIGALRVKFHFHNTFFISGYINYRNNSKYWDTQTSYRSCP